MADFLVVEGGRCACVGRGRGASSVRSSWSRSRWRCTPSTRSTRRAPGSRVVGVGSLGTVRRSRRPSCRCAGEVVALSRSEASRALALAAGAVATAARSTGRRDGRRHGVRDRRCRRAIDASFAGGSRGRHGSWSSARTPGSTGVDAARPHRPGGGRPGFGQPLLRARLRGGRRPASPSGALARVRRPVELAPLTSGPALLLARDVGGQGRAGARRRADTDRPAMEVHA